MLLQILGIEKGIVAECGFQRCSTLVPTNMVCRCLIQYVYMCLCHVKCCS